MVRRHLGSLVMRKPRFRETLPISLQQIGMYERQFTKHNLNTFDMHILEVCKGSDRKQRSHPS